MKHITSLVSLSAIFDSMQLSTMDHNKLEESLQGLSTLDVDSMSRQHLRLLLEKSMPHGKASYLTDQLKTSISPPLVSLDELKQQEKLSIGINHIFPFELRSGMLHELTILPGCRLLPILQVLMEQYLAEFSHKVLYLDSTSSSIYLSTMFDVDVMETMDLDGLERGLDVMKGCAYGMVIINSLSQQMDTTHPGYDLSSLSTRAIHLKRIMHRLKLYALRMNLIIVYINDFRIDLDTVENGQAKLLLLSRGGNIVDYAPHVRITLFEDNGPKAKVINASYLPAQVYPVNLPISVLDDFF